MADSKIRGLWDEMANNYSWKCPSKKMTTLLSSRATSCQLPSSFIQRMSSPIHDQIRDTLQPANCSFLIDIRLLALPNSIKASATQCWKTNQNVSIFELSYFLCNIDTNAKDSIEWTPILWKLALMDTKKLSNHWSINETAKPSIWILKTFMDGLHLWRLGQNLIKWDFLRQISYSVCASPSSRDFFQYKTHYHFVMLIIQLRNLLEPILCIMILSTPNFF